MATKFIPNPVGIAAVARSAQVAEKLKAVAEAVAENARSVAPELSGDYIDGIAVEAAIDGDSAVGRVNANDWKSALIEFGTEDTPTFAPLRRGAEGAGLTLREE
jgi:hypothetical protein